MATIQIIKRAKPNRNGLHALQLRILKGGSSLRLNTGRFIKTEFWDDQLKCVKKSHPNYRALTSFLTTKLASANKTLLLLETEYPDFTLYMLKQRLLNVSYKKSFSKRADEFFETLMLAGNVNRCQGERPAIRHLEKFSGNRVLAFEDITPAFLKKFKAYLSGTVGITERSIMNYLTTIRIIYNLGIEEGDAKLEHYPFGRGKGKIKIRLPEPLKIGLEAEEVTRIENLQLEEESFLDHTRKVWLFSFYFAGMRVSDVLMLKWESISGGRLHYTMGKNNKPGSMTISPKAQLILDHYTKNKCNHTELVFPDMRDVPSLTDPAIYKPLLKNRGKKLNKHLKEISELAGINKPLTMHIARHTFGNIAGDKIPLPVLQQLYRHSSITTTVNYQRAFMNKGTDDALLKVVNFEVEKPSPDQSKRKLHVV